MKKSFKLLSLALSLSMLVVSGCSKGGDSKGSGDVKVMKLGIVTSSDRSLTKGLKKFAEIIEKESGGKLKGEVFADGLLGGDRQVLEALQMGTVQGTAVSTGVVAAFAPRFDAFDLPYLFKDKATAYKVFDGPIGTELLNDLPKAKLVGLGYWENGFRHVTNNKRPIQTAEDFKGLKLRTLESKVHVEFWKMMGTNPTPMSFSQLYSAMEQGVVDGQENPYGNVVSSKFNEVQKYLSNTGHVYNANVFLVSKVFWDKCTDQEKEIIKKAAIEARDYQRKLNEEEDQSSVKLLTEKGMKINDLNPGEKEKIMEMAKPLYESVAKSIGGDLVDRIIAAAK